MSIVAEGAGWMKMLFVTEVDLSPGHIVLDGDPAPPLKGVQQLQPLFGRCLLRPNGRPSAIAELAEILPIK